ncbi:MAG TPA: DUF4394 domain-containing protein, partial [Baekduia sp.]|nr:DUF4394 domain-containing protein [Baekduia sp.]
DAAPAERAFALAGGSLVTFDPDAPATVASHPLAGVNAGETLVGIDIRPQNGMLYGLGVNATSDTGTLYVIGGATGYAAPIGTPGGITLTTDGVTPVDLPGADYGFDVNPAADRIRVTTATGLNFRINPNTGVAIDGNAVTAGTNPDGPINGVMTGISGAAYTNARPLETVTTLYTLGPATHKLMIQNPPNNGTQTNVMDVTLGGTPVSFSAVGGFDIDPAVVVTTSNTPATGDGYAILTVGATTHLYRIALANGAAADLGPIGDGIGPFRGLALQRDLADGGFPAVGLSASGTTLRRFATAAPDTGATATLTGVTAGETIVAIAWRPQTGQLLGLGVNSTNDTGTLYMLDPQSGSATAIGAAGSITYTLSGSTVDLPAAGAGWGIDASPASDRIRIVAGGGLNARVNPNNGQPIDSDGNGGNGTTPDTPHNGLATSVTATSYTNAFTQLLGGASTQYVLEPVTDQLLIQNTPNSGTLTAGRTVTLGGGSLDFGTVAGFDIPGEVAVTTSGTVASGEAIAALTVGGTHGVYRVDLATGAAALLGTTSTALASIAVGDAQRGTPVTDTPPGPGGGGGGGGVTPTTTTPAPPSPPAIVAPDKTAPRVTKLAIASKSKRRLTITFTTSEAGKATIRLLRETPGRRKGKSCVAKRRTGARCTIRKAYGSITKTVTKAGKVTITVKGKVGAKKLATGGLRVEVTVRDAAGNASAKAAKSGRVKR